MKSAWDFTSIALLGRSLFESIMLFRYFTATTGQDECLARILVLHLHDRCERIRLFERLKRPEDVTNFRGEARNLKELLSTNPYFQTLDTKRQKEILNGSRPSILTLSEMGDRYAPDNDTWTIHQFLSHYAHSHPLGFMRNDDQGRDTLANEIDKLHIPGLLRWLSSLLEGSIEVYKQLLIGVRE